MGEVGFSPDQVFCCISARGETANIASKIFVEAVPRRGNIDRGFVLVEPRAQPMSP